MAIIMISRGTFSGGRGVAEELAARLGFPCISRGTVFDTSVGFGIPEAELDNLAVDSPAFWKQVPGRRIALVNIIRAALLKLSRDGNLV
jgi:hypothetical protein